MQLWSLVLSLLFLFNFNQNLIAVLVLRVRFCELARISTPAEELLVLVNPLKVLVHLWRWREWIL
jgi:hypothetical protein